MKAKCAIRCEQVRKSLTHLALEHMTGHMCDLSEPLFHVELSQMVHRTQCARCALGSWILSVDSSGRWQIRNIEYSRHCTNLQPFGTILVFQLVLTCFKVCLRTMCKCNQGIFVFIFQVCSFVGYKLFKYLHNTHYKFVEEGYNMARTKCISRHNSIVSVNT